MKFNIIKYILKYSLIIKNKLVKFNFKLFCNISIDFKQKF